MLNSRKKPCFRQKREAFRKELSALFAITMLLHFYFEKNCAKTTSAQTRFHLRFTCFLAENTGFGFTKSTF
jgi:hypothetical protein